MYPNYFEKGTDRDEKIDKFLDALAWYHSEKMIDNTARAVFKLNEELVKSQEASKKLTQSLNRLTFWGVLIAGAGVLVAFLTFAFDVVLHFNVVWVI